MCKHAETNGETFNFIFKNRQYLYYWKPHQQEYHWFDAKTNKWSCKMNNFENGLLIFMWPFCLSMISVCVWPVSWNVEAIMTAHSTAGVCSAAPTAEKPTRKDHLLPFDTPCGCGWRPGWGALVLTSTNRMLIQSLSLEETVERVRLQPEPC